MKQKRTQKTGIDLWQGIIAVGGGILLTLWLSPDAKLVMNDVSNHLFESRISAQPASNLTKTQFDIPYCETTNPRQTLDLYTPKNAGPHPLVIFIHGGGWAYGDKKSKIMTYYGTELVKQGIAVASLNYRLHPDVHYPGPYEDVACALSFLGKHSGEYNLTNKWGIMGDSAGAELAAYAMQSQSDQPLKAFVGLYGPYDLGLQLTRTPKKDVDAANFTNSHDPIFATSISPITLPVKTSASYLLIHGKQDKIVPFIQSENYYHHLKNAGAEAELLAIDNSGHYIAPTSVPNNENVRMRVTHFFITKLSQ